MSRAGRFRISPRILACAAPLAILLAVALWLRWPSLHECLWLDELHSAWASSGSWSVVAERARIGNQSPLYFYALKLCLDVGGPDEVPARLLSVLPNLMVIAMLYWIALRWTGSVTLAVAIAAVAACDPKFIFYGTETRPYALVQLLALTAVICFADTCQRGQRVARLEWILASVLLCYLHYTAVVIPLASLPGYLWLRWRQAVSVYSWRQYVADTAVAAVATMPLWAHMAEVAARRDQWSQFISRPDDWSWIGKMDLDLFVLVPLLAFTMALAVERATGRSASGDMPPPPTGGTPPPAAKVFAWWDELDPPACLPELCWIFALTGIAVLYAVAITGLAPVMLYRYLIVVPPLALLGWLVLLRRLSRLGRVLFLVTMACYCLYGMDYAPRWWHERPLIAGRGDRWDKVAAQTSRDAAPILLRSGFIESNQLLDVNPFDLQPTEQELVEYCLAPLNAIYDFGEREVQWPLPNQLSDYDAQAMAQLLEDAEAAWIILRIPPRRYEESMKWTDSLIEAHGGGEITSKKWYGPILLLRVRFSP